MFRRCREHGFALVVTVSLMVLLTVVGLGLLSVSAISLRSSGHGSAMSAARANARMAMMIALGELQKNAGPDQRITARADVDAANNSNPRLTGVWKSWDIKATSPPSASDYDKPERDKKFLGWMVSSQDPTAAAAVDFAKASTKDPVTLWGKGTLGSSAPTADLVTASKISTGTSRGAYAWAVMDEGVKARVNTPYVDGATTKGMQSAQLGSGECPNTAAMPALANLKSTYFEQSAPNFAAINKGISRLNFEMAADKIAPGTGDLLKPLAHDITPYSVGLFTDTAAGGLKEDFSLLTNSTSLPSPYNGGSGKGVYVTRLGMTAASAPSEPRWEAFQQYSQIYRDSTKMVSSGGVPVAKLAAPSGWVAAATSPSSTTVNRASPPGVVLLPTLAKVQVMFSLVGRDLYGASVPATPTGPLTPAQKADNMHGPQDGHFRPTKFDYDLHLMYTPIVTLHNPYNVALEFSTLRVEFVHVPFAMKIFRNGVAQSSDYAPLETMYGDNHDGAQDKIFGLNLKTANADGTPGSSTVRLMPGEVKVFSPYIDPNRTYKTDLGDRKFWDIYVGTGITNNIDAISGWRGDGIGFDCDNVAGNYAIDGVAENGHWGACMGLAWDDQISVEFVPKNIPRANNKFVVTMTAALATSTTPVVVNAIEMDFEKPDGLSDFMTSTGAKLPFRYPKADASPNYVKAQDMVERATTPIGSLKKVKPFAMLSVQAKSTSGARDASAEDGRIAAKPWCFAHANIGASSQKVITEHSANFSHEIDLQQLNGSSANLVSVELATGRSNFITGNTSFNGTKFGAQYDIPITPLQSLVGFNGANPGGASGYLPRFAQPIGNSWAHPLLDPSKIITTGGSYPYLDHSFLLNLALFDHFYFSGLADQSGSFGTGKNATSLATDFAAGKPLVDPRVTLYTPAGQVPSSLPTMVSTSSAQAYTKIASWQVMNGAFNINSTSVSAWKAMLGSIRDSQSYLNKLNKAGGSSAFAKLPLTDTNNRETRISRFRLPASESNADGGDFKDSYWLGPREYTDAQIQTLAEKIVEQVRLRGPFLSMSEFVNRRLGPATDDKAQRGALQQAIDNSNLNQGIAASANAGFEIPAATVSTYKYANPKAGTGSSYQGAPGYLSQADLLAVLGDAATARSDTFTVRGYGEARDANGKVTATATCEAVVQRLPEYVDATDKPEIAPAALVSSANKYFGRRFQVVSFTWLRAEDI